MRFAYTQPISTFLPDIGYSTFPVLTFLATKTYESICGPSSGKTPISVTKSAFSFTSQADADAQAIAAAMSLAIMQRSQDPCGPSTLPPANVEESEGPQTLPEVDAGTDQAIEVSTVSLNGDVSNASSFFWTQISGPTATIDDIQDLQTSVTLSDPGDYVFRLTGINDFGEDFDEMTVVYDQIAFSWRLEKVVNGVTTIIEEGDSASGDQVVDVDSEGILLPAPDAIYAFIRYVFVFDNPFGDPRTVYFKISGISSCQFDGIGGKVSGAVQLTFPNFTVLNQNSTINQASFVAGAAYGSFPPDQDKSFVVSPGSSQVQFNSIIINDLQGCTVPLATSVNRDSTHRLAFEYFGETPP